MTINPIVLPTARKVSKMSKSALSIYVKHYGLNPDILDRSKDEYQDSLGRFNISRFASIVHTEIKEAREIKLLDVYGIKPVAIGVRKVSPKVQEMVETPKNPFQKIADVFATLINWLLGL